MRTYHFFTLLLFAAGLRAQPTVYLRSGGPAGYVITGASNTTPVVVQTAGAHGLNPGDIVVNWGVGATVNGNCVAGPANGIRNVKAVVDATHVSLTDLSGADVAATGPWCDGSNSDNPPAGAAGGKLTPFTLAPGPRGWLDGANGPVMRKLALGTNNGLTGLAVSGNVATATTSYDHGLASGDKIGVWGSGTAALNHGGHPYTVTVIDARTFTFAAAGIADGTYSGVDNHCGPNGDSDCLRISQLAYTGEIWWDAIVNKVTNTTLDWQHTTKYQHVFDGGEIGKTAVGSAWYDMPRYWASAAVYSFVDPSNAAMLNVAKYCVNHIERVGGVGFNANERFTQGGSNDLNDYGSYVPMGASMCYAAARDYLSTSERQTFIDKMLNDLNDPTPCNKERSLFTNKVLAADTARGGGANTITLAASDSAATGYYVNNVVKIIVGGSGYFGLVTAYDATTKSATVTPNWGAPPSAGTAYTVYATITISGTTSGGTATVTGHNTTFTSDFVVGDAVIGGNAWKGLEFGGGEIQSKITAIASDTSMTVLNGPQVQASTTTPTILWMAHQWQPGDCGLKWLQGHWVGGRVLPTQYPPNGGSTVGSPAANGIPAQQVTLGGNNGFTYDAGWLSLDFAVAGDDAAGRDIAHLAMTQEISWDYLFRHSWNYSTGFEHSGSYYSSVRTQTHGYAMAGIIQRSVPSFPMPDLTNWYSSPALQKMYGAYPDRRFSAGSGASAPWPVRYGAATSQNQVDSSSEPAGVWQTDPSWVFLPNSTIARYYSSFVQSFCCIYSSYSRLFTPMLFRGILEVDPRIGSSDYTVQPTQYLFQKTARDTGCVATGFSCPPSYRGDAVISRTGWTAKTDTHVLFDVRTFWSDHDIPEGGTLRVYKAGHLLNSDQLPPGAGTEQQQDSTTLDTMPRFGNANTLHLGVQGDNIAATANIIRWASANHGAWDSAYGDASSRYAYALADLSGSYRTAYNRVQRHFVHFKKAGTEEVILQFDDIDVSNAPTQVETHIHYTQTGEMSDSYREGTTICPDIGGCASLNSSRLIQSMEDGGAGANGDPDRTYGIVSRFFSPGTISVRDDGSPYSGGNGHTHRVSLCGGGACGNVVNQFEAMVVHKIASSLDDTALTAKTLPSGSRWAAVETIDASGQGGKVAMIARNGDTPFKADVQTDHPGIAQYLIAGLQPGFVYRVYRNDDATDVIRQAVADGDNTLYFEAPAGSYSIFPEGLSNLFLRAAAPGATVGTAFEYRFQPQGTGGDFAWSVTAGSLPRGLVLSAGGMLSGIPSAAGDATFTIAARSAAFPPVSDSATVTIHVAPPGLKVNVTTASTAAVLRYGRRGLSATQPCTASLSLAPGFSPVVESFTDTGGSGARAYVAGAGTPLLPSTRYYARVTCGPDWTDGSAEFVTAEAAGGATAVPVWVAPRLARAASVRIDYGASPSLGNSITVPCAGGCSLRLPAVANALFYWKRSYLDAGSGVLASSSIGVVAAGR